MSYTQPCSWGGTSVIRRSFIIVVVVLALAGLLTSLAWACMTQIVVGPGGQLYTCVTCPGPVPTTTCLPLGPPLPPPLPQ